MQAGYYCSVCECILRDSQSYLDHINGKYHNRALGMSMRVERSTANDVSHPADLHVSNVQQILPWIFNLISCSYMYMADSDKVDNGKGA